MTSVVDQSEFGWRVRVYQEDVDAGGVVYHANFLRYMERARSEWLRALNLDQSQLLSEGIIFVVRRCTIEYKRPAYLDDELDILLQVRETSRARLDMFHRIVRKAPQAPIGCTEREELVTAEVTIACVCRQSMRPKRIPDCFNVWS